MQWFLSLEAWQQALLASLFMYASTALGASLVLFFGNFRTEALALLTGGAAGVMIAASFFSLLLPALETEGRVPALLSVTVGFLLGGAFLAGSDLVLTKGRVRLRGMGRKNALTFFAVTLHNIPEGMAVGVAFAAAGGGGAAAALVFAVGIAVQNFPEGACVAFPLKQEGMTRGRSFLFAQGSGLVEIPSCVVGALAASTAAGLLPWALAFSAGAMIAVVCSELLPECFSEGKTCALCGVIFGFTLMMVLDIAFG